MINQESKINSIKEKILKVCEYVSDIFRYNVRSTCNINIFKEKMDQNYLIVWELQQNFNRVKEEETPSSEVIVLYMFYYMFVVVSTDSTNFLKEKLRSLQKRMFLKEISVNYFNACLSTEKGCILESVAEPKKIGILSKISKNAPEIFQYEKDDLLGMDVSKLLPASFVEPHK